MQKALQFIETLPASIHTVWQTLTTEAGARTFFAPDCRIDLRVGGAYEMYFDLDAPPGSRGGEGCIVLALEEPFILSLTWNAPPEIPSIRVQRTHVTIGLELLQNQQTRITLIHDGWGTSEDWIATRNYFQRAWGQVVIPRLKQRFLVGPHQWAQSTSRE
jgi:uncharacterized protein YndB with AHSA1/START domain